MRITAVGAWPGTNMDTALRQMWTIVDDLPALPLLPARGLAAQSLGRTLALLEEFPVSMSAGRWQTSDSAGIDMARAEAALRSDLDCLEEFAHSHTGALKVSVVGPWTLAARVGLRHGEKVLVDRGARRDLLAAWVHGVTAHLADIQRRLPSSTLVLDVDDAPGDVVDGVVRTASGLRCYDPIDADEVIASYRLLRHACDNSLWLRQRGSGQRLRWANDVDVVAVDLGDLRGRTLDAVAELLDGGRQVACTVDLRDVGQPLRPDHLAERILDVVARLGLGGATVSDGIWLSASATLAEMSPDAAQKACEVLKECAGLVSERLV